MSPTVKNSGQKSLEKKGQKSLGVYISFPVGSKKWYCILLVLKGIPNINVHGRQKASMTDCLSQWHLHTVFVACTLLDIMGQILSASPPQFHCFTWHYTSVSESTWPNFFFFLKHALMLGSTLFHRNSKINYIKLQKPFFRSTLYLYKMA